MPTVSRRLRRVALSVATVAVAITAAVVVSPSGERTIEAAGGGLAGAGGEFHGLEPARILDTRLDAPLDVAPFGAKASGANSSLAFDVPVLGRGGLGDFVDADDDGFDDNVLAVVANITVAVPSAAGHLTVYPKGATAPNSSAVNYLPGQVVANTAILRPGLDGEVTFHLVTPFEAGTAHVIVDISGYYSTSDHVERGARVVAIEPTRIYDSNVVNNGVTLKGAKKVTLPIRGATDLDTGTVEVVPDDPAVIGVIVNLTGVNQFPSSRLTHFSLVPDDFDVNDQNDWPGTSNLNLAPDQTRANLAILPVGADGKIRLFSLQGEVRAVVDVAGYLVERHDDTLGGRVIPLVQPFRVFDTRLDEFYDQPLGPANAEAWSFEAFVNDVKVGGDWVGPQTALFGNLTAAGLARQYSWAPVLTHMSVYPAGESGPDECKPPPNVSNVNLGEGEAVPNLALLRYGGGVSTPNRLCVFNFAGYVDYLLDVYAIVLDDEA